MDLDRTIDDCRREQAEAEVRRAWESLPWRLSGGQAPLLTQELVDDAVAWRTMRVQASEYISREFAGILSELLDEPEADVPQIVEGQP
jgi:hypothetical protein